MADVSKIIDDPQNFCNYSLLESSIMVESQIAPSEHQDIRDHLETPMGNVSDEEEEKEPSPLMKNLENDNYLDKLTEVLK